MYRRSLQHESPVLDGGVERKGFLSSRAGKQERGFVDAFEDLGALCQGAAERFDQGLLLWQGVRAVKDGVS